MKWINPWRIKGVTNLTCFTWSEASKELSRLSSSTFFLSGKLPEHKIWKESIERDWRTQDLKSAIPILGNVIYTLPPMYNPKLQIISTVYYTEEKEDDQLHLNSPARFHWGPLSYHFPKLISKEFRITFNTHYYHNAHGK